MHPYNGISAALGTQHQKEDQLAPSFAECGISLVNSTHNTDELGTFTGEIPRPSSPVDVVRMKARRAMDELRLPYGLASEGTFGPDPLIPLFNVDIEILIWIDDIRNIELVESYRSFEIIALSEEVTKKSDIDSILQRARFPEHAMIVRSSSQEKPLIYKGLRAIDEVREALKEVWRTGEIAILENDLRAHMNPTRQNAINAVGMKLAERLKRLCPNCDTPGWGVVDLLHGARCRDCGLFNSERASGEIYGCARCLYRQEKKSGDGTIGPAECEFCNP